MQKRFAQKIEAMRRLIGDTRSASFCHPEPSACHPERSEGSPLRYLLAVSGGMDSMCMADLFLNEAGADSFAVAHCNFHLRGAESDGDEALVKAWADSNGVRMHRVDFNTREYASAHGVSIEMAARELRYGWFAQLCDEFDYDVVAVAHNANDNAETLMLNLLRGTGLNGLHGMAEVTLCHPERSEGSVPLFRPLLEFTRKQIEGYVIARRVQYRDDSTNFESEYKRNMIRNEVFPFFEKINPSFVRTLNREIGYFAEAGAIVEDWCRSKLPDVAEIAAQAGNDAVRHPEHRDGAVTISIPSLMSTDHWRYLLYYILQQYGFNSQTIASVEDLLASDRTISGKRFESPTHTLRTEREILLLHPNSISELQWSPLAPVCPTVRHPLPEGGKMPVPTICLSEIVSVVKGAGIYNFGGVRWQVEVTEWSSDMPLKQPAGVLIADADKLRLPFVCRPWRQGDWFVPLGMRGRKKVSDLFADLKYTSFEKESALMIVDTRTGGLAERQHIAGVLGVRIDDRYKVTAETRRILRLTILNNTETI